MKSEREKGKKKKIAFHYFIHASGFEILKVWYVVNVVCVCALNVYVEIIGKKSSGCLHIDLVLFSIVAYTREMQSSLMNHMP
jgi:hypothetical protein